MQAQQLKTQRQKLPQEQVEIPSQIKQLPINHTHKHIQNKQDGHSQQPVPTKKQNVIINTDQNKNSNLQPQLKTGRKQLEQVDDEYDNIAIISSYFTDIIKKSNNRHAENMSEIAKYSVCKGIETGEVFLSENQESLDEIIYLNKLKEDKNKAQEQNEEQKKKRFIEMQLKYLNMQLASGKKRVKSRQSEEANQFIGEDENNLVFSKKRHQQFINRINRQRSQLSERKKSVQQKLKSKIEQEEILKKIAAQEQEKRQKQQRKKKILQKIQQQKKLHEQKLKQQQQHNRRLSQLKHKKFLHDKLQQKYQTEVLIPSLEQKKKKLKQIREMSRAFNIQDINNHQKQYLKKREQILSTSQAKKQQWHYKMPEKSQKLAKLLEQQSLQAKLKLQQKKRNLEQKIQRQQQFSNYLKQKYQPSIDPKKRQEIQQRIRLRSQAKQKQIPDRKALGIHYLEQVKNQRKKSAISQMQFERKPLVMEQQDVEAKKSQTNYLKTRRTKQQYEQIREKRIQRLINSSQTDKSQKIMKLQLQAQKLIEEQKRVEQKNKILKGNKNSKSNQQREAQQTTLLLASIKAKMGIIDLYNKQ